MIILQFPKSRIASGSLLFDAQTDGRERDQGFFLQFNNSYGGIMSIRASFSVLVLLFAFAACDIFGSDDPDPVTVWENEMARIFLAPGLEPRQEDLQMLYEVIYHPGDFQVEFVLGEDENENRIRMNPVIDSLEGRVTQGMHPDLGFIIREHVYFAARASCDGEPQELSGWLMSEFTQYGGESLENVIHNINERSIGESVVSCEEL